MRNKKRSRANEHQDVAITRGKEVAPRDFRGSTKPITRTTRNGLIAASGLQKLIALVCSCRKFY